MHPREVCVLLYTYPGSAGAERMVVEKDGWEEGLGLLLFSY